MIARMPPHGFVEILVGTPTANLFGGGGSGAAVSVAANPGLTVLQGPPVGFDTVTLVLPQGVDPAKFARIKVKVIP